MSIWQMPRESQFTLPTERCPHPEWWSSENNMATESELANLVAAFVRACQPEFVIEVGSHYGQTTSLIGKAIRANGHGEFISLEINPELYGSACHRCLDVPEAHIVNINSLEYIPEKPIDLLFVDGQEYRVLDVEHFFPYCSKGAIIIMHDMLSTGYKEQLPRVYELCGSDHILINSPRGMLILRLPC